MLLCGKKTPQSSTIKTESAAFEQAKEVRLPRFDWWSSNGYRSLHNRSYLENKEMQDSMDFLALTGLCGGTSQEGNKR